MRRVNFRHVLTVLLAVALTAAALMMALPETGAQIVETPAVFKPQPVAAAGPVLRTWEEMARAPLAPAAVRPATIRFRPTMSAAEYQAAKARAAAGLVPEGAPTILAPAVPPPTVAKNYNGVHMSATTGNLLPPDSEGAVGATEFVQIVNSYIVVYQKGTNAIVTQATLAQFFNYNIGTLFDPRVVYDKIWKRWIVTADADPESATVQKMFVAVSTTSSAGGTFHLYNFNTVINAGDFFDYPMVGYDQDAIFISGSNFVGDNLSDARLFYVAKAKVYNGLAANWLRFKGLAATLTVPIVLGQDANTWFVSPQVSAASHMAFYRGQNLSRDGFATLTGPINVAVPGGFAIPPNALQTSGKGLDTLDARFQNVSTQVTNGKTTALFNVHCINAGGKAKNQFYEFDVTVSTAHPNPTIKQQGLFGATSSSYDFNPHLAANGARDCFTVWSATDPANGKNAMVYFGGRRATADLNGMGVSATPLFTSATWYDDQIGNPNRWGDYSAITIDPANQLKAWLTNETIFGTGNPSNIWGTRIGAVQY